jgi:hypothetical protein
VKSVAKREKNGKRSERGRMRKRKVEKEEASVTRSRKSEKSKRDVETRILGFLFVFSHCLCALLLAT